MTLSNDRLSITVEVGENVDPRLIADKREKILYADEGYAYELCLERDGKEYWSHSLLCERHEETIEGDIRVLIEGRPDFGKDGPKDVHVQQVFRIPKNGAFFEETISLRSSGSQGYRIKDIAFGFRKIIYHRTKAQWADAFEDFVLVPVPHRRRFGHRVDRKVSEYKLADLLPHMWENVPDPVGPE